MIASYWDTLLINVPDLDAGFFLSIFFIFTPIVMITLWMSRAFESSCTKIQILAALLMGAVCVIPVAGLITKMGTNEFSSQSLMVKTFYRAFVTAAAVEEIVKIGGIFLILAITKLYKSPRAVILMSTAIGLGFATVENILYVSDEGLSTAVVRSFTAVPCHACLGAITGYYLSRFFAEAKLRDLSFAIGVPIILHGMYDLPLMASIMGATQSDNRSTLLLALFTLTLLIFWTRYVVVSMSRNAMTQR